MSEQDTPIGYQCLLLHAHLPFVRHAEYDAPFEERWLHEAILECYLPLLEIFDGWERDAVPARLTLSLSPTLLSMFADPLLRQRTGRYLRERLEMARHECVRTRWEEEYHELAHFYRERIQHLLSLYEKRWERDLCAAFRHYAEAGLLELITCNATHGFLPLLQADPTSVRAQVTLAQETFERLMGFRPRGFWLAECGYYPGLETTLREAGVDYFFVDAHGLLYGEPRPPRGVYAPACCTGGGPAVFGRDLHSSRIVWSAREGYPGDPWYREFYRDLGHDLDLDYVRPYIHPSGQRLDTGFKYHRITGGETPLGEKAPYDTERAHERARVHAGHFHKQRCEQAETLCALMDRPPIIVSPYDAELFGHWWFEGPLFLDALMRRLCMPTSPLRPTTAGDDLDRYLAKDIITPSLSSWGQRGYAEVWLDPSNDWIYPELLPVGLQLGKLVENYRSTPPAPLVQRALNQAIRELLLAQSSDWAFILQTGTTTDYARQRVLDHLKHCRQLSDSIRLNSIDEKYLEQREHQTPLFPGPDLYRHYFTP